MRQTRTLRIMQFRQLLPVFAVRELPGVSPRSIEIDGSRMDLTTSVLVNGARVTDFAALSDRLLLVQLPDGLKGALSTVAALCEVLQPGMTGLVYHDMTTSPRSATGGFRTLQQLIKLLLTTPGSDVFDPGSGGGLRGLAVRNIDQNSGNALAGDVESRVLACARTVINRQATDPALPRAERLLSATVSNVVLSAQETSLNVTLDLKFHDGSSVVSSFGW